MSLSLTRKALILVAVPVLFEVILVGILLQLTSRLEQARQAESHAREFALHLNTLLALHMQRVSYSFLAHGTLELPMARRAKHVYDQMQKEVRTIDALVQGRPPEDEKWLHMRFLFAKVENGLDDAVKSYKGDDRAMAAIKFARVQQDIDEIFRLGTELSQQQSEIQQERHALLEQYNQELQNALYFSVLSSVAVAFALAFYFNRGTSSRLKTLMHNTDRLSAGLAPDQSIKGGDELAKIDTTYHQLHQALVSFRQKERAILDNAADVICSIDNDLRFSDINQAATELWGFSFEELLGRRVVEVIFDEDQSFVFDKLKQAAVSDKPISFEARVTRSGKTLADTAWVATGSASDHSVYCVIHDVTEQKRIESLKRDFVAMVSHDLRSPLTSIQMVLSLLEQEGQETLPPDSLGNLSMAKNSVNRLMALVNNLLDLERLDSAQMVLNSCEEPLSSVVTDSASAISGISKQKKITISNQIDDSTSVFIDRDRITQVLVNLLSNALKFSPKASTVSVSAEPRNDFVRVNVIDQGRGVPAHLASTIFERFKQVQDSDAQVGQGTGLGLAICKAIIERHHGQIGVESNPGGGSIFWFTVPASQKSFDALEQAVEAAKN
ncbi:MAG: ATP-binding protein [Candidatus Obscuribacterales bacterium]